MRVGELLADGFDRVREVVHEVADGLDPDLLTRRPGPDANPIGWLLWHLTRVQDDHLAAAEGTGQAWTADGWAQRFALPYDDAAIGYGQSSEEVGAFAVPSAALLVGYADAVHARSRAYVAQLSEDDLDRVVDPSYDPPVTLAVRLVSVLSDTLQHAGQAAYVSGLLERA